MTSISLRVLDRLGLRVALALAVILLPLAIVSILRSQAVISQTEARNEAALFGETVMLASAELSLIDKARGVARSVAAVAPSMTDDPETCSFMMQRVAAVNDLSFVGFVLPDGSVPCSSVEGPLNFADDPVLATAVMNPVEVVRRNADGAASGRAVVYVLTPAFDAEGALDGFAVASVPKDQILNLRAAAIEGSQFITVNAEGEVLTSSLPIARALTQLPRDGLSEELLAEGGTLRTMSVEGDAKTYAVTPVVSGQIVMVGLLSETDAAQSLFYLERATYFPLLMWLASLVVGFFVVEFLVSRHVKTIVGAMRRFGENRQTEMPATLSAAPVELRDIGDAYQTMTEQVVSDAAQLEETLQQKNVLLREVHHRTKNNLQMISSIMSMQIRRTESPEMKEVIRGLQDRVMALATVHKGLYQTSGVVSVQIDELLADIVRQMQALSPGASSIRFDLTCPPVLLQHDLAVPFSLLVTEALTNTIKYATALEDGRRYVDIDLHVLEDDRAALVIKNTFDPAVAPAQNPHATGFGAQLMSAFATQLNASIDVEHGDGAYVFTLGFTLAEQEIDPE